MYHRTNFRGNLIISKNSDFYTTYHKLNIITLNGNRNVLHINHRIHKLIINGNNNNIEINPLGNVKNVILRGNINKIISKYSQILNISDFGIDNKMILNTSNTEEKGESDTSDLEILPQRFVINSDEEFLESEESEEDSNSTVNNILLPQNLVFEIVNNINSLMELKKEDYLNKLIDIFFKSQGMSKDIDNDKCPICYENFVENEQVKMTACFHIFHFICIEKWIETKIESPDCPICRRKL